MRIKNWKKFQHFRDRKPPWIKLYRDILDDLRWHQLDPSAAKTLIMLWLIASEYEDGQLPNTETLCFRLRISELELTSTLSQLSHWLEQGDIATISSGYQEARPEVEREKRREEKEARHLSMRNKRLELEQKDIAKRYARRA